MYFRREIWVAFQAERRQSWTTRPQDVLPQGIGARIYSLYFSSSCPLGLWGSPKGSCISSNPVTEPPSAAFRQSYANSITRLIWGKLHDIIPRIWWTVCSLHICTDRPMIRYFIFAKPLAISAKDASFETTAPAGCFSICVGTRKMKEIVRRFKR